MDYLKQIQKEYLSARRAFHIECNYTIFENILRYIIKENPKDFVAVYQRHDELYEQMKVSEYLKFFSTLLKSKVNIQNVLDFIGISDLIKVKIYKLNESQKLKVQLARELLKDSSIFLFEQALFNLSDEDAKLIIKIIESLVEKGVFVVSCSLSFREVCLMPGNSYFYKDEKLIPINESIDDEFISTKSNDNLLIDKLQVKVNGRILLISISDIYFAESIDSITNLFVKNSYLPTSFTLDELESKLSKHGFFRTHRSYLVNTQKIKEVEQWTKNSYIISLDTIDSMKIPLSKRRYKEFLENI